MKLYIKCTRDGVDSYSAHEGMDLLTITTLLQELGSSNIIEITEAEYLAALPTPE